MNLYHQSLRGLSVALSSGHELDFHATLTLVHGKNGFVTVTKLGTTNKFFVAAAKNFAATTKRFVDRTKRFVDRTKHFVVVTKCLCYSYFNK